MRTLSAPAPYSVPASRVVIGETVTVWDAPFTITELDLPGDGWVWVRGEYSDGTRSNWHRLAPSETVYVHP